MELETFEMHTVFLKFLKSGVNKIATIKNREAISYLKLGDEGEHHRYHKIIK